METMFKRIPIKLDNLDAITRIFKEELANVTSDTVVFHETQDNVSFSGTLLAGIKPRIKCEFYVNGALEGTEYMDALWLDASFVHGKDEYYVFIDD